MKTILRTIIPKKFFDLYHYALAFLAHIYFGRPSSKMVVIGVTGTKGKTSTINYIWSVLEKNGIKTGVVTTANVRIGEEEILNPFHMTMPGRFKLQRFLREMVRKNCRVAIVETTSQGIAQFRHIGIQYDIGVFTNLTPEHIDAHKTFENYRNIKGKLFARLSKTPHKKFKDALVPKTIIANLDSEHMSFFLNFDADQKIGYSINTESPYQATHIATTPLGTSFECEGEKFNLSIPGVFNVYNALPAIAIGEIFHLNLAQIKKGIQGLTLIPGRMEEIKMGQEFKCFVDYAHEKQSMTYLVEAGRGLVDKGGKVIVLLGAEGGGRDKAKRTHMGEIVGQHADYVVVSNVDPYEDDPTEIVEDIARVAEAQGKVRNQDLFVIEDRREGIAKALSLAGEHDAVFITGKGAEQSMIIGGKTIPWDDRDVVREELEKILN